MSSNEPMADSLFELARRLVPFAVIPGKRFPMML